MARQAAARIETQDCPITQPVRAVQEPYRELNFLSFPWLVPLQAATKEPVSSGSVACGRQIHAPHRDTEYNPMNQQVIFLSPITDRCSAGDGGGRVMR